MKNILLDSIHYINGACKIIEGMRTENICIDALQNCLKRIPYKFSIWHRFKNLLYQINWLVMPWGICKCNSGLFSDEMRCQYLSPQTHTHTQSIHNVWRKHRPIINKHKSWPSQCKFVLTKRERQYTKKKPTKCKPWFIMNIPRSLVNFHIFSSIIEST